MLYLGTLAAIATFASALAAAGGVGRDKVVHEIMTRHRRFALIVVVLSILPSLWRIAVGERFSTFWRTVHFIIAVIMTAFLFAAANKGGTMVCKHYVGGQAVQSADSSHSETVTTHQRPQKRPPRWRESGGRGQFSSKR